MFGNPRLTVKSPPPPSAAPRPLGLLLHLATLCLCEVLEALHLRTIGAQYLLLSESKRVDFRGESLLVLNQQMA